MKGVGAFIVEKISTHYVAFDFQLSLLNQEVPGSSVTFRLVELCVKFLF